MATGPKTADILKPLLVSPALKKFVRASEISRVRATKKIWDHIKLKQLQDEEGRFKSQDKAPPVQRKPLKHRDYEVDLESRLGKTQLEVFEDLAVPSHKTKNIVNSIAQMEGTKKVLLVDGGPTDDKLKLATRNLHYVNVLPSIARWLDVANIVADQACKPM